MHASNELNKLNLDIEIKDKYMNLFVIDHMHYFFSNKLSRKNIIYRSR